MITTSSASRPLPPPCHESNRSHAASAGSALSEEARDPPRAPQMSRHTIGYCGRHISRPNLPPIYCTLYSHHIHAVSRYHLTSFSHSSLI
jgi:hypothetical protein